MTVPPGAYGGLRAVTPRGIAALVPRMTRICGSGNVVTDPLELRTYECDGLTSHRATPALVVLPSDAGQVAAVVRECAAAGIPFVARGSGTGLSGGAMPREDGVLIVMSKMRRVLEVDPVARRAIVEPGVTNLAVTQAAAPHGLFYAPDPSSQVVCSVGGNVAENSGGAHCLKHGFTVNHVTGLEVVTPSGELTWLGDGTGVPLGYDLLGAFTGSEGTLGIVTKVVVKLTVAPQAVHLVLAGYATLAEGGRAVSDIIAAGIVPAAIEMMDALSIEAAEAAVACGYPEGAGAVLLVELDGPAAEVEAELATVMKIIEAPGRPRSAPPMIPRSASRSGRAARPRSPPSGGWRPPTSCKTAWCPAPRWATCSRGSPPCRPRRGYASRTSSTPATVTCTRWCCITTPCPARPSAPRRYRGRSWTPASSTAGRSPASMGSAWTSPSTCREMFSADDLDTMQLLRCAFDPASLCNPGKVFPTPRLCGEVPGHRRAPHPAVVAGEVLSPGGTTPRNPPSEIF